MNDLKAVSICLQCGNEIKADTNAGSLVCEHCTAQYIMPKNEIFIELNKIVSLRQERDFFEAEQLCRELIKNHPDSHEAYWQLFLLELGVYYIAKDESTRPAFFFCLSKDPLNSDNLKNAIMNAENEEVKSFYRNKSNELSALYEDFLYLFSKEDSYDIFITCEKSTEASTDKGTTLVDTEDYFKAKKIYDRLKNKYRVFFFPVTIGDYAGLEGGKYEASILKAFQASKAIILLGSKHEYFKSQRFECEWKRFAFFLAKQPSPSRIFVLGYEKCVPRLPPSIRSAMYPSLNTLDTFYNDHLYELRRILYPIKSSKCYTRAEKVLYCRDISSLEDEIHNSPSPKDAFFVLGNEATKIKIPRCLSAYQASPSEAKDLSSAEDLRKSGRFKNAVSLFSSIIKRNPNSPLAYKGRLLSKLHIASEHNSSSGTKFAFCANDFEMALKHSSDSQLSYSLIDLAISLMPDTPWKKGKIIFNTVVKYIHAEDFARTHRLLSILKHYYQNAIEAKKCKLCEDIFSCARQLFFKENIKYNMEYTKGFAYALYSAGIFDTAKKYLNELAFSTDNVYITTLLFASIIGAPCHMEASIDLISSSANCFSSKPDTYDITMLLKVIIADADGNDALNESIKSLVLHQVRKGKNAKTLIEAAIYSYKRMGSNTLLVSLLLEIANEYLLMKRFDEAKNYFTEILAIDARSSLAYWGLLKCKTSSSTDQVLLKHREGILKYEEFDKALRYASSQEYEYFMSFCNDKA